MKENMKNILLCTIVFTILLLLTMNTALATASPSKVLFVTYETTNLVENAVYNGLINEGFEVTRSTSIPADMSKYSLVIVHSYDACWQTTADYMEEYIRNGGGVVLISGVPANFPKEHHEIGSSSGYYDISYISGWFGTANYQNVGVCDATVATNNPVGTTFLNGAYLAHCDGWGGAAVSDLNHATTQAIAMWDCSNDRVFAFTNEYKAGKVFYISTYGATENSNRLALAGALWAANNGIQDEIHAPQINSITAPPDPKVEVSIDGVEFEHGDDLVLKTGDVKQLEFKVTNEGASSAIDSYFSISISPGLEILSYDSSSSNMEFKLSPANSQVYAKGEQLITSQYVLLDAWKPYVHMETQTITIKLKVKNNGNQWIRYRTAFDTLNEGYQYVRNPEKGYILDQQGFSAYQINVVNENTEFDNYDKKFTYIVFDESAFEKIHRGDISGYRQDYSTSGTEIIHSTDVLEHPDYYRWRFYERGELNPTQLANLINSDIGISFIDQHFVPTAAIFEFYLDLHDHDMKLNTVKASESVEDRTYSLRYNYAALTLIGHPGEEYVILMPYFSNNPVDYIEADLNGGMYSYIYETHTNFLLSKGYPKEYFMVAEKNLGNPSQDRYSEPDTYGTFDVMSDMFNVIVSDVKNILSSFI